MHVIVIQNRDKTNGLVNGQKATVVNIQGRTIFLRLPNSMIVQTYTVSAYKKDELHASHLHTYPFVPPSALTICKVQGQTLKDTIVWLDSVFVPAGVAYVALSRIKRNLGQPTLSSGHTARPIYASPCNYVSNTIVSLDTLLVRAEATGDVAEPKK